MKERYKIAKKKQMRAEYQPMGNNEGYMCDFEGLSEDEEKDAGYAEVKRPKSEFEAEMMREEIMQNRLSKNKTIGNKYRQLVALEP